ncbi:MAG: efflux RND transporter periplasmic adaptor subunit, partial [Paludibacter sp.]|nr:efflux RND transporter periplasmic adaptor subunit [Paludibacter sp.]
MKKYSKLVFAALITCSFVACSNGKGTEKQEKIIPVKIINVETLRALSSQNYVGTVEESVAVSLAFSAMGTVEQVLV